MDRNKQYASQLVKGILMMDFVKWAMALGHIFLFWLLVVIIGLGRRVMVRLTSPLPG